MIQATYLIIAVIVFFALGLTVTYSMSVGLHHVGPLWCYISYTGNYPPESCIFSFVLSVCTFLYITIMFLRYVQLSDVITRSEFIRKKEKSLGALNLATVVFGCLGALGLSVTGSFQQRVFHIVHIIGVILCTYLILCFVVLQTYFSFVLQLLSTSLVMKILRAAIAVATSAILFVGPVVAFSLNFQQENYRTFAIFTISNESCNEDLTFRIGAGLEWSLFVLNQIFVCTFCPDFQKIVLYKDKFVLLG